MRLPIESWLLETQPLREVEVALREAIIAYKAVAYRAALLFSYLGWGLALRGRLLALQGPSAIPSGQWLDIAKKLRNEDTWDAQVFDCTQMGSPKAIFDVSYDLRNQVKYWKNRRNDCAHFKTNEINDAHVESFWSFLISNLDKFVPIGSPQELVASIDRYFDLNFTPPGTDILPLAQRLRAAI